MPRQPLRDNQGRQQTASNGSIPAPIGGLNSRDPIAALPPTDAVKLTNFFPDIGMVTMRRGFVSWATGMSGEVRSLISYVTTSGNERLFAVASGSIYNVTAGGVVGAPVYTGLGNSALQYVNFSTPGGNFVIAVNGTNAAINYNGAAWQTTPAITGVSSATLRNVAVHKNRLWFLENGTLTAWYLAPEAIGGAATQFPLGSVFTLGGYLLGIGTLSNDSGDSLDDYLAFITSEGEVALYQGTDPDSIQTWGLVSVFRLAPPFSNRAVTRLAGDLIILTMNGAISLQKALQYDRSQLENASVTAKIDSLISAQTMGATTRFGWELFIYPAGRWLIVNAPVQTGVVQNQFVMNTLTGAWCQFTGMNAGCWGLLNNELYFGGNLGTVFKADTGYNDNGQPVEGELKTAWSYLGSPGRVKRFTLFRPLIRTSGNPSILSALATDFRDVAPTGAVVIGAAAPAMWNSAQWDVSAWADEIVSAAWQTAGGIGTALAIVLQARVESQALSINAFDVLAEPGGVL